MSWFAVLIFTLWLTSLGPVKCEIAEKGNDYRFVRYEDLLPSLEQFFDEGVEHFDQLLFDSPHHQLIVGKNMIFFCLSNLLLH